MSLGMAPVFTVGNEMIISAAPPERAGAASAISETSSEFGGALGIAVFGSLGTAIYRPTLAGVTAGRRSARGGTDAMATLGGRWRPPRSPGLRAATRCSTPALAFAALQVTASIAAPSWSRPASSRPGSFAAVATPTSIGPNHHDDSCQAAGT